MLINLSSFCAMEVLNTDIEGIVLAAGLSSRAEIYKMTLDFVGKTLIERCIEGMYDVCSKIIVVCGYKMDVLIGALNKYSKIQIVYNENYFNGMFTSVKEGIKQVKTERFFLVPGDYPTISRQVYESMLMIEGNIVIPLFNGKKGHPVLMKSRLIRDILEKPDDSNLQEFIDNNGFISINVQDDGILTDIDTFEDYLRVLNSKKFC